jgi:hypothetical protein
MEEKPTFTVTTSDASETIIIGDPTPVEEVAATVDKPKKIKGGDDNAAPVTP